jgi:hypothetical protein
MLSDPIIEFEADYQGDRFTTNGVETSMNREKMFRLRLGSSVLNRLSDQYLARVAQHDKCCKDGVCSWLDEFAEPQAALGVDKQDFA